MQGGPTRRGNRVPHARPPVDPTLEAVYLPEAMAYGCGLALCDGTGETAGGGGGNFGGRRAGDAARENKIQYAETILWQTCICRYPSLPDSHGIYTRDCVRILQSEGPRHFLGWVVIRCATS